MTVAFHLHFSPYSWKNHQFLSPNSRTMLILLVLRNLALVRESASETFKPFRVRPGLINNEEQQEVSTASLAICAGISAAKTTAGKLFEGFLFSETNSTCRQANFAPDFDGDLSIAESVEAFRVSSKDRPWGRVGVELAGSIYA